MSGPLAENFLEHILARYKPRPSPQVFVETGTHRGITVERLIKRFREIHTIELSRKWHEYAVEKFRSQAHVSCYHGESDEILADLLPRINEPAMFFLDAHYSGGDTAFGKEEVPLLRELSIIRSRREKDIVIIDDARLIGKKGTGGQEGHPYFPVMTFDWRGISLSEMKRALGNNAGQAWMREDDRLLVFTNRNLADIFFMKTVIILRNIIALIKKIAVKLLKKRYRQPKIMDLTRPGTPITPAPLVNVSDFALLVTSGFMSFRGGILNPGVIEHGTDILLLARAERYTVPEFSSNYRWFASSYAALSLRYNGALQLIEKKRIRVEGRGNGRVPRIGDSRLFRYKGTLYANHTCSSVPPLYRSLKGKMLMRHVRCRQGISALETHSDRLVYLGEVKTDFPLMDRERNWVYFTMGEDLYLIYLFSEFVLLKLENWGTLSFKTVKRRKVRVSRILGDRFVALSTNPVDYDEDSLFLAVHTKMPDRIYRHWGVLLDKQTLLPKAITRNPIMAGGEARGINRNVVFITGVIPAPDRLLFFWGEGDSHISSGAVSRKMLDDNFVDIHQEK
ncbi:hypothetical protein ACFL42_01150 [Candidatus Omnitrophota bacterium]